MASKLTMILTLCLVHQSPGARITTKPTTTTDLSNDIPTLLPDKPTPPSTTENLATGTGSTDPHDNTTSGSHEGGEGNGGSTHLATIELVSINFPRVKYPLVFTLVILLAGATKLLFHLSQFLSSNVPESCVLILVGVIFGVFLYFVDAYSEITLFRPNDFFLFLLPPIILEAAFSLHDRTFAENIGSVLLFAGAGTVLACFSIGLSLWGLFKAGAMVGINCTFVQMLVFCALIVSVDPVAVLAVFQEIGVNDQLYFMVFGEALLNDGVTVVLYNVLQIFNKMEDFGAAEVLLGTAKFCIVVVCAVMIGIIGGLVSSFICKYTKSVKVIEPLIIFGFAYLSFVFSELLQFSGIISMVVCGVLQVHYAFQNITNKSRLAVKFVAKGMAQTCETVIFLFIGMVIVDPHHDWNTGFTLWATVLCIVWRIIIVCALSLLINYFDSGRIKRIGIEEMFMIGYGGLRGAVSYALVALIDPTEIPQKDMFVTATLFIIIFTVCVQGGTIKWLIKRLRISLASKDKDLNLSEEMSNHVVDHVMGGLEIIVGYTHRNNHLKKRLEQFDDRIIRPRMLGSATTTEMERISTCYEKLVMKEHYKNLYLGGADLPRVKTEIRDLDSELALDQLVKDSDKHEVNTKYEGVKKSKDKENRIVNGNHRHPKDEYNAVYTTGGSLIQVTLHLKVSDENLVHDHKHQMVNNLKRKHTRNKLLSQLRNVKDDHHVLPTTSQLPIFDVERSARQVNFTLHENDIYENSALETDEDVKYGGVAFHL